MPLIETKGAASAQGFGLTIGGAQPVYIEDVFSTYLYTGNGSTQTITNGIDLSGKGGLTWFGSRNAYVGIQHYIIDSARGIGKTLYSYSTDAQGSFFNGVNSYNSNGVTLNSGDVNASGNNGVLWTFRKQPKFFDVVTYTGNGSAGRTISHNLGSYPGCIIVKKTSAADNWLVWHRSLSSPTTSSSGLMWLNTTNAQFTGVGSIYVPSGNTTTFTVASGSDVNQSGATYVAYLFAHDAGGFGLSGTDNVISCGSYTGNGSASGVSVNLGYEPQWVLRKRSDSSDSGQAYWLISDNMRGIATGGLDYGLLPNVSNAENGSQSIDINPTGFTAFDTGTGGFNQTGATYIYIAIRRGPMKVPTSGTSVFAPVTGTTNANFGFPADFVIFKNRAGTSGQPFFTRLLDFKYLNSSNTFAEGGSSGDVVWNASQTTFSQALTAASSIFEGFRRAPGFFDVVCYTGTGASLTLNHNLGVVPELAILKKRSASGWWIVDRTPFNGMGLLLNDPGPAGYAGLSSASSATISIGVNFTINESGATHVAYLFATCPGVSKVGSYTGTGTTQQINCGFTGGARFVLIKRTDSTGDWYVWDTARGIVAGNDPHLSLNSTAAEVTTNDSIDTDSTGFIVNQLAATNINVSSATYIFLAIA